MKGELEYRAVVAVGVDVEAGEVESVTFRAATADDEMVDVSLSLEGEVARPDQAFDCARQIVDAGAPFELSGWWAPSPDQRWAPAVEEVGGDGRDDEIEDGHVRPHKSPAKEIGQLPPFAALFLKRSEECDSVLG
jgi:hypothetical protein